MNSQLQELIAKILLIETEEVTPELKMDDIEDWDSMTHLVLISDIEKEFDITFTDEEVTEITSIYDIMEYMKHKGLTV